MFFINKISKIKINYINIFNLFTVKKFRYQNKVINNLKKFLNINKIILLGRARTGIYLLVKHYLKYPSRPGRNVLVTAYTIPDVINLIKKAGGKPLFVDFEYQSTYFSILDLKDKIKKYNPKIVILTHYHLEEKNIKKILNICKKKKIIVIEDKAISYGSIQQKKLSSDGAIFSFSSFKLLNYYYGGALTCKNDRIFKKIQSEVNSWKTLSLFQYFRQASLTIIYQVLTYKFIFNYFGFYYLKYKFFLKNKKSEKFYFSSGKFDKSYFTRPSNGFFNEIFYKIAKAKAIQRHRMKIFLIYYKYLKKISIPYKITHSQILNGSCFNFLIYHKKSWLIKKKLYDENFDIGTSVYENLNKLSFYKKKYVKTKNLDNVYENLLFLPTHELVSKKYASNLAKKIIEITKKI